MKKVYMPELLRLRRLMDKTPDTPLSMSAKVLILVTMNMRYEKVAFRRRPRRHPYLLTREIVRDAVRQFEALKELAFIESVDKSLPAAKSPRKEAKHQELFNEMWNRYEEEDFKRYIQRYVHRLRVNKLNGIVTGKRCVDLGCGNGNLCFALLECGASYTAGVDFGERSLSYAARWARRQGLWRRCEFRHATVYETGLPSDSFDFALQNGVFHHLDDEDRAIRETVRLLKPGGWFWYYTDGEGGISYDLWDASVHMLRRVPVLFIEKVLLGLNVSRDKMTHIMDGLSATYAHTSWKKLTRRLASYGFNNFRRLTGGFPTDFDLDRIQADPYGRAKFGEGDLRVLCQLLRK